jgi:hypothetical protein
MAGQRTALQQGNRKITIAVDCFGQHDFLYAQVLVNPVNFNTSEHRAVPNRDHVPSLVILI